MSARDLPPLSLMQGFEAAARHLSFTRAGAELFLTQSAVSRQVKALEEWLGLPLFERRTRALSLTPAGQRFHRTVSDVLRQLEEASRVLRQPGTARTFTVTTTPTFASLWLIPRLASYTQAHPKVDVRISASSEVVDLDRSAIELAIRYGDASLARDGSKLFAEEVFPVCAPAVANDSRHPIRGPGDLAHHVLLHFADQERTQPALDWGTWLRAVGQAQLVPAGALHFSHYDQVILAAINGQGVALGRSPLIRRSIREGKLCMPFSSRTVAARAYYVLTGRSASGNSDVDNFVSWIHAEAACELPRPQHGE